MNENGFPIEIRGTKAPVLAWANEYEIESQALEQLRNVSELPGLHGLRVMPDVHFGNGATVGSVIAMEQALAPAAVGVDIGCGVNAVRTSLTLEDVDDRDLHALRMKWQDVVPVGFKSYDRPGEQLAKSAQRQSHTRFLESIDRVQANLTMLSPKGKTITEDSQARARAAAQLGTLGGGNHFIELTSDSLGYLWITLHSGSRNIGKSIAEKHISIAMEDPRNDELPSHLRELSLFYKGTPQMDSYLNDLRWAQEFAMRSRTIMMERVSQELFAYFLGRGRSITFDEEINCHHNYVAEEVIDGRQMIVTRKGAISAKAGELALIPGSMATGSYIVRGLGNEASFQSASHGAGRRMSRGEAKRRFTVEDVERTMQGIEARKDAGVIDEISLAYKSLDDVIDAQKDLVEVVQKLDTILCVKG